MNRGIVLALSAYIFWGIHPIYWKILRHVPSEEIVAHRVVWSFIFFAVVISFRRQWSNIFVKFRSAPNKFILIAPAILIGSNWALYIWAVNANHIIETSLAYFISPLISVFLGVFFLHENLRRFQWLAVFIAAVGVIVMTFLFGQFPWISLCLASSWATYGLLRKKSPLNSVEGLTLETAIMITPALIYLTFITTMGTGIFFNDFSTTVLLIGSGITSGLPLLVFIIGARLINLTLIGILQYVLPTLLFIVGFFIYNESLDAGKMIGFIFIWVALIIYTIEGSIFLKNKKLTAVPD